MDNEGRILNQILDIYLINIWIFIVAIKK
jgi:hypothetical protein